MIRFILEMVRDSSTAIFKSKEHQGRDEVQDAEVSAGVRLSVEQLRNRREVNA